LVVATDSATPRARPYLGQMTQTIAIRQGERRFASRRRDAWTAVPKAVSDSASEEVAPRGRGDECAVLDALLEGARAGQSGALLVRGEAGVGKTALFEYAIGSARDLNVARATGIESEMKLAFAALHQLCAPMLGRLDRLPAPQREALQTTFGLSAGPPPDRFFVGLAVLSLLSEVAEERPLVCVIDDAQWLDRESAQVLAFVARRLHAESVVVLLAEREPGDAFQGLAELVVRGLRDADARALLASVTPGRMDERIVDEVLAETRGNATRWRYWSSREDSRRRSWRAVSGWWGRYRCRAGSRRAFWRAWRRSPRTPSGCCWWRRRNPPAIRAWCRAPPSGSTSPARRSSPRSRQG
jgi:hypothetical protein